MPPKMRKQGKHKGAGLKVIGLLKKKGKTTSGPTAFLLKSEWEKTRGKHYINIYIHVTLSFYSNAQLVCRSITEEQHVDAWMTMFVLDKPESTSLLMPEAYWRPQWILCALKVVGPALCVTQTYIPL